MASRSHPDNTPEKYGLLGTTGPWNTASSMLSSSSSPRLPLTCLFFIKTFCNFTSKNWLTRKRDYRMIPKVSHFCLLSQTILEYECIICPVIKPYIQMQSKQINYLTDIAWAEKELYLAVALLVLDWLLFTVLTRVWLHAVFSQTTAALRKWTWMEFYNHPALTKTHTNGCVYLHKVCYQPW